jgi:LPS sulfotransferase NodH
MERPWNRTVIRVKPRWALLLREQLLAAATVSRALFAGTHSPRPRFIVHSLGRSGSTLLTDLLACHPDVECDGEILSHRLMVTSPERLVRDRARLFRSRTYGFKMRPRHYADQRIADPAGFLERLHGDGWRVLHLERRNLLRIALSWVASRQTGVVHRTFRDRNRAVARGYVPIDLLREQLTRVSREVAVEEAALARVPHLRLSYEEDLVREDTRQPTMNRVFDYLDLPPATVSTKYVRLSSDRFEDFVENYDEMAAALAGTQYEPFLSS